jgi:hypothetical protein
LVFKGGFHSKKCVIYTLFWQIFLRKGEVPPSDLNQPTNSPLDLLMLWLWRVSIHPQESWCRVLEGT